MDVSFDIFQFGIDDLVSFLNGRGDRQERSYFLSQPGLSLFVRQLAVDRYD